MRRHTCVAVLLLLIGPACGDGGGGTPTSPSPATPNVQGQYTGTYAVAGCTDDRYLAGTCFGTIGVSGQLRLSLTQSQNTVTGSVVLGPLGVIGASGTFQGSVAASGALTGSATLGDGNLGGVTRTNGIASWSTTLSGDSLAGSFNIVTRTTDPAGTRTVSATILSLNRIAATGVVGGIWAGRSDAPDRALINSSTATLVLTQNGDSVTGTINLVGLLDLVSTSGPITGRVSGTTFTFTFTAAFAPPLQACTLTASGSAQVAPGGPPLAAPGSTLLTGSYTGTNSCPAGRFSSGEFALTRQ